MATVSVKFNMLCGDCWYDGVIFDFLLVLCQWVELIFPKHAINKMLSKSTMKVRIVSEIRGFLGIILRDMTMCF